MEIFDAIRQHASLTLLFPLAILLVIVLFFVQYGKASRPLKMTSEWIDMELSKTGLTFLAVRHPMEKRDILPLSIIFAAFMFLALFKLGDFGAPQSFFQFTDGRDHVVIELDEPAEIDSIMYYTGLWTGNYVLEFSGDGASWSVQNQKGGQDPDAPSYAMSQPLAGLFKWRYAYLNRDGAGVKYIRLTASRAPMELGELVIYGPGNKLLDRARISSPDAPELFDEQGLAPERPGYMNSMYFDEVYHARTGYEFLRGVAPYELSHPPLGKAIIAGSISAFGMTPFGYRSVGAFFGVLMLIVMYIFLKNMFGRTAVAVCGTLLFGFEFMRFVQTRIATVDTFAVFFILAAYFFMYRHITTPPGSEFRDSLASLLLSGVFFGLGCATKWNVIYAGIGLGVIFAMRLFFLARHYRANRLDGFGVYLTKTLLFSVLFFGAVPAALYFLSYIPFVRAHGLVFNASRLFRPEFYREYFDIFRENQVLMLDYHGALEATHPFSSAWWQWLLDLKPILYVNNYIGDLRSSFAAFGNPAVWWGGLAAMVFMALRVFLNRDGKALFILLGYLSQLLPWIPVSRIVFIYHYFPGTLFLVMALAHIFGIILERKRSGYALAVYGFTAASGLVFAMFYPALTGIPAPHWYFETLLNWIPVAWPF